MTETSILESTGAFTGDTWCRHVFTLPKTLMNRQIHLMSVYVTNINIHEYEIYLTLTIFGQLTLEKIPIHLFPLLGDDMNLLQFFQNPIYLTLDDTINYIMLSRKSSLDDDWDTPSIALEWTDVDNVDTTSIYSSTLYFLSGQSNQLIKLYNEMVMICDQEIELDSLSFQQIDGEKVDVTINFLSPYAVRLYLDDVTYGYHFLLYNIQANWKISYVDEYTIRT